MKEQKDKKVKTRKVFSFRKLVVLILLIYIVVNVVIQVMKMPIKHILILGNNLVSDHEIIRVAKLEKYPPIYLLNTKKTKDLIMSIVLIKDVEIKKDYFGKLTLKVEEYKPLFYKKENNAIVLDNKEEIYTDDYSGIPMLINYVPDVVYEEFIQEFAKLNKSIIAMMNYIEYSPSKNENNETIDEKRFLIQMNDDNKVYTNPLKLENINYYLDILASLENKKGILNLDAGNYFKPYEDKNEKETTTP